jgi:hypothetical protein
MKTLQTPRVKKRIHITNFTRKTDNVEDFYDEYCKKYEHVGFLKNKNSSTRKFQIRYSCRLIFHPSKTL